MPYCVRCGVELADGAASCPLCGVEVVLPKTLRKPASGSPRPQLRDVVATEFDRKLWIQVVSALMAIPALGCVVIDAVSGDGLTWSLYVVASLTAVWICSVSPFLYRRNVVPLWITIDAAALLGLLYVINALPPASDWFQPLALPIVLTLFLLVLLIIGFSRRGILRELHKATAASIALAAFCIAIESAVDLYLTDAVRLDWSLIVLVLCVPLAVIAEILQRRRGIVEGMKAWLRM